MPSLGSLVVSPAEVACTARLFRRQLCDENGMSIATKVARQFRGLRHLAERIGSDFIAGIVLLIQSPTSQFLHGLIA